MECSLGSIPYLLVRSSARRTSTIQIDEQAQVTIYVPFRTTQHAIDAFIREKLHWVEKCVRHARRNYQIVQEKRFDQGGEFLFLGKKFHLEVVPGKGKRIQIGFSGKGWFVYLPNNILPTQKEQKIKDKLVQWYRQQAEEIIGGRIFHYSRIIGVEPRKIVIRTQKRMWGCCDYTRQLIHINWQIILSPIKVVDYVVVHELCHLIHPNHSRLFWREVEKHMPDYQEYKQWLRTNHT
ncbi:MAG: M48 family metallopeptidase, partial [Candidatus Omnitrophica bacterium]|nr:M48 family metallopeptidase [Candidatus Omnitrophota bacterium]